jgi:hypothetical protein
MPWRYCKDFLPSQARGVTIDVLSHGHTVSVVSCNCCTPRLQRHACALIEAFLCGVPCTGRAGCAGGVHNSRGRLRHSVGKPSCMLCIMGYSWVDTSKLYSLRIFLLRLPVFATLSVSCKWQVSSASQRTAATSLMPQLLEALKAPDFEARPYIYQTRCITRLCFSTTHLVCLGSVTSRV